MIDHGLTMYPARSKQISSDGRNRQYMNSGVEDLHNDICHMTDSYNEHQVDRDWIRRLNRDRDSKSNRHREERRYKDDDHYPEDRSHEDEDFSRERYSYENAKGKYQRNDYKRYSGIDRRLYREDSSDRKGHGSQGSYPRAFHDGTDLNKSKDQSRDPGDMKDSRESLREERESRSRSSGGVRERDCSESSRESRSSGRSSKSSKELQEGRDSKHGQGDKDRNKRESSWNECEDGGTENMNSLEHTSRTAFGESREGDSYKNQVPNNTIMIRGLAQHITENDIRQDILRCGLMPKDIRLIRKKDTGTSRGFAFVEFNTLQESSQWMEMKHGVLMLQDHYRAVMHFSIPKDSQMDRTSLKSNQDWHCIRCGAHNFKRRDACFKCYTSRQESEDGEGSAEVSFHPTSTVLLRGLDVLSTEDSVLQAIKSISSVPIRSIRIGQDALTNTSRGVCYLEMNHVMDAIYMHNALIATPPLVDGKKSPCFIL